MDTGTEVRRARLFRNGRSQAVRIPKEFEFEGEEVELRKAADGSLVVRPLDRKASTGRELIELIRRLGPIPEFPGDPGEEGLPPLDEPDVH